MADDELLVGIEQAFWPRGVVRGLAPVLRTLGDKHGGLVIAAQQTKGNIMVKGPWDKIDAAKAELLKIVEEYFPDAPTPEELLPGGGAGAAAAPKAKPVPVAAPVPVAPPAPTPAPRAAAPAAAAVAAPAVASAVAPTVAAKAPKPAREQPLPRQSAAARALAAADAAAARALAAAGVQKAVSGRKRPRPAVLAASPDLLWECMRNGSSFARRGPLRQIIKRPFSSEPQNLMGYHCFKYSGLAAQEALDIRGKKHGDKESIELTQSHTKASRALRPARATVAQGLSKCPARGLVRLDREINAKFYRRSLLSVARQKYLKVQKTFRKRKLTIKSRRAQKTA